jgi:enoyl-CoA hydratase/carnithine racemase
MTGTEVLFEVEGGVGIARLNRPEKFNCLSAGVVAGLNAALDRCEADRQVRALVICGEGKNFSTGADLDEVLEARKDKAQLEAFIASGHSMLCRLEASPLPVLAAVHGLALAGGLELAMAADIVFADPAARLGCQHARYGLLPGWGGTQRLPRRVGLSRALELMYSARWLPADEALAWGLVNHVSPAGGVRSAALDFARDLARKSRTGLAAMKRLARQGLEGPLAAGLALERAEVVDGLRSADVSEGLAAFMARREPDFA